jgi:hypothetical protein
MAKIIHFLLFMSYLQAQVMEIEQMEDLLPFVDEATWVLFDVDETLEPNLACLAYRMQQSGEACLGLTIRRPPLSAKALEELACIGIDFSFNISIRSIAAIKTPSHWEGGLMFLTEFNRRDAFFKKWVELMDKRPIKIALVSDHYEHLAEMQNSIQELDIPCYSFHFTKSLDRPFNPVVAAPSK